MSSPVAGPGDATRRGVSVVVPTWLRAAWLDRCLQGIVEQGAPPEEVIVVGRPQDIEAQAVVERHTTSGRIRLRWEVVDASGHMPPVELGTRLATQPIVAFLDDDAVPQRDWLSNLLAPFEEELVACVGGRVDVPGAVASSVRRPGELLWYGRYTGNLSSLATSSTVHVVTVVEGNCAWRKSVLLSLTFDQRLNVHDASMYGLDLSLQARSAGWQVLYQPLAAVTHHVAPRDTRLRRDDLRRRVRSYARNYTLIGLKHFRGLQRAAFFLWWWLVGERGSYGALTAIADRLSGRRDALLLMTEAMAGRREGWRSWRHGR
jgi:GT2 family glycosyltransferase